MRATHSHIITRAPQRISLCSAADTKYFLDILAKDNFSAKGNALSLCINRYNQCMVFPTPGGITVNSTIASGKFYRSLEEFIEKADNRDARPIEIIETTILHFINTHDLRQVLRDNGINGFHIISSSDTPPESGLGGSASAMVSALMALSKLTGVEYDEYELVQLAYKLERKDMGILGGIQDQVAAVYGGLNYMEFRIGRKYDIDFKVQRLPNHVANELSKRLLLVRIPREKGGKDIHIEQEERGRLNPSRIRKILNYKSRNVCETRDALLRGDDLGPYLLKDMELKSKLGSVETERTREIFEIALNNGASGGRIIGAGRGGCMIFYCEDRERVLKSLNTDVEEIKFGPDHDGVKVIRGL